MHYSGRSISEDLKSTSAWGNTGKNWDYVSLISMIRDLYKNFFCVFNLDRSWFSASCHNLLLSEKSYFLANSGICSGPTNRDLHVHFWHFYRTYMFFFCITGISQYEWLFDHEPKNMPESSNTGCVHSLSTAWCNANAHEKAQTNDMHMTNPIPFHIRIVVQNERKKLISLSLIIINDKELDWLEKNMPDPHRVNAQQCGMTAIHHSLDG